MCHVLTSANPTARYPNWQITRVDNDPLTGITCPSPGTCLAIDDHGRLIRGSLAQG